MSWNHLEAQKSVPGPPPGPGPWCPRSLMPPAARYGESQNEGTSAWGLGSQPASSRPSTLAVESERLTFRVSAQPTMCSLLLGSGLGPEGTERPGPAHRHCALKFGSPPCRTSPPPLTSSLDLASTTPWGPLPSVWGGHPSSQRLFRPTPAPLSHRLLPPSPVLGVMGPTLSEV